MVSPALWQEGSASRCAQRVLASPYTVLDFDGFDGKAPQSREEVTNHLKMSLAVARWLRDELGWTLAALIWTGGKSLHAWFHTPRTELVKELREGAGPLGLDAGLIGRPEHPCRLPGQVHSKTGKLSRILWLQAPHHEEI
jgi:hypothetical protein